MLMVTVTISRDDKNLITMKGNALYPLKWNPDKLQDIAIIAILDLTHEERRALLAFEYFPVVQNET